MSGQGASTAPLLRITNLSKRFGLGQTLFGKPRQELHALRGVTVDVMRGETLGLVGESGSGKSTVARVVMQLYAPSGGTVELDGVNLHRAKSRAEDKAVKRRLQMIFQDPYASLNPRMSIGEAIKEGMTIHGLEPAGGRDARVAELLAAVGLGPDFAQRYPHELSGGQRQRVGITRALAVEPEMIIADEAVSALDVSVQAQVLNLLKDLKKAHRLTYIFISHDLRSVAFISDRIAVMYLGRLVEVADTERLFTAPWHPYTQMLLGARFVEDPARRSGDVNAAENRHRIRGEIPSAMNPPSGCPFHPRCGRASDLCKATMPELSASEGRLVACHHPGV